MVGATTARPRPAQFDQDDHQGRRLPQLGEPAFRPVQGREVVGLLEKNPVILAHVKTLKPRSVVRFLGVAEEKRLRDALNQCDSDLTAARVSANEWRKARNYPLYPEIPKGTYASHLTPVVLLAMNTGLHQGELVPLLWSGINLDAKMLTVRRKNAKSDMQRHIPLSAQALPR